MANSNLETDFQIHPRIQFPCEIFYVFTPRTELISFGILLKRLTENAEIEITYRR